MERCLSEREVRLERREVKSGERAGRDGEMVGIGGTVRGREGEEEQEVFRIEGWRVVEGITLG